MADQPTPMHDEDLPLDETEAEDVRGGSHHKHHAHTSVADAQRAGFEEVACTREGTVMRKGNVTITVPMP